MSSYVYRVAGSNSVILGVTSRSLRDTATCVSLPISVGQLTTQTAIGWPPVPALVSEDKKDSCVGRCWDNTSGTTAHVHPDSSHLVAGYKKTQAYTASRCINRGSPPSFSSMDDPPLLFHILAAGE
ncbi:hypothetical protein GUJ93_ZPchr0006g41637 [Zizania palustris]|uniref:Uncharacterized protein n=1 Tax=Zizania palustris TaxID=103762 RepID=A0A8J5VNH0_ZIZPA|nr:hypothetical protein GUJ93_ZPchr0006g41637 [Zizania palustris]